MILSFFYSKKDNLRAKTKQKRTTILCLIQRLTSPSHRVETLNKFYFHRQVVLEFVEGQGVRSLANPAPTQGLHVFNL